MKLSIDTYLSCTGERVIRIVDGYGRREVARLDAFQAAELMRELSDAINTDDVHVDVEESFSHTFEGCAEDYHAAH